MAPTNSVQPSPGFSLNAFFSELLDPCIEQLTVQIASLPTECAVEQIHQTRVLIRTLRAYLDTFDPILRKSVTAGARIQLKSLDALLAPIRNVDVTLGLLMSDLTTLDSESAITQDLKLHLIHRLIGQRNQHKTTLLNQFEGHLANQVSAELTQLQSSTSVRHKVLVSNVEDQRRLIIRCLEQEREKLTQLAHSTLRNSSRARLHEVRIQAKQVRYSYEAAHYLAIDQDDSTIILAGKLHRLLGKHQDLAMLEAWLKQRELVSARDRALRRAWLRVTNQKRRQIAGTYKLLLETEGL